MAENHEELVNDTIEAQPSSNDRLQTSMDATRRVSSRRTLSPSSTHKKMRAERRLERPGHPTLHDALPSNSPSKFPHLERPHYSLAGSFNPQHHAPSYVDPNYYAYNPSYLKPQNVPVWGLAKPLPRVVRSGMRRGGKGVIEDRGAAVQEPGSAEAIPQVGMVGDQREEAGKERLDKKPSNDEARGYGRHRGGSRSSEHPLGLVPSDYSIVDRYGTPKVERGDPMEEWNAGPSVRSNDSNAFEDSHGDLGDRKFNRLPSVPEQASAISPRQSTVSIDFARSGTDNEAVDLEAGPSYDDSALEDEEARQYIEEEREMHNKWASIRARFREPLAECLATIIVILIGLSTNLAVQLSKDTYGSYQSTNWAWGLGATMGIYVAGGISGGHLNPAISLTLCLYRGFPFRKALVYIAAQLLGGLLAALIAYAVYRDAIIAFDAGGGSNMDSTTASLYVGGSGKAFFTQPASFVGVGAGFANEFVATAILSCVILALGDDSNAPPGAGMHAFIVGLVITVLTMAFGYNTGPCLNPARDFGPRVATMAVGYGGQVFTAQDGWWIYGAWGATISGALVGGFFYDAAIFVGGESPVNYPGSWRRRAGGKAKGMAKSRRWGWRRCINEGFIGESRKEAKE